MLFKSDNLYLRDVTRMVFAELAIECCSKTLTIQLNVSPIQCTLPPKETQSQLQPSVVLKNASERAAIVHQLR